MSSARKRASIAKANNEADHLRQRLMLAEHHASVMRAFAEAAARRGDALYAAIQRHQAETRYAEASNTLALADKVLYEALKVGAGDTVPMGSNSEVRGASRNGEASSREAATSTVVLEPTAKDK